MVRDKLSSVEEKLSETPPLVSTQQQPLPSVTEQMDVQPTQPPPAIVTTASNADQTTTTMAPDNQDDRVSSTGDGQNTNIPTGEPTTPLTESTEAHATGATGDVPLTDRPVVLNMSSSEATGNSSTEEGAATMEGVTSTTEGALPSDSNDIKNEEEDEKKTNEQAIAALRREYPFDSVGG